MNRVLHILTQADDSLACEVIRRHREAGETVEVIDLSSGPPDYDAMLEKVFTAESVQVW